VLKKKEARRAFYRIVAALSGQDPDGFTARFTMTHLAGMVGAVFRVVRLAEIQELFTAALATATDAARAAAGAERKGSRAS
jgi:hypothetical protein